MKVLYAYYAHLIECEYALDTFAKKEDVMMTQTTPPHNTPRPSPPLHRQLAQASKTFWYRAVIFLFFPFCSFPHSFLRENGLSLQHGQIPLVEPPEGGGVGPRGSLLGG